MSTWTSRAVFAAGLAALAAAGVSPAAGSSSGQTKTLRYDITFSLPGGQIAAQLLTTPGPAPKPFAVTGGSGDYRNARGDGTLVEYGKRKGSITFRLTGT
jgi:hypothetical protein